MPHNGGLQYALAPSNPGADPVSPDTVRSTPCPDYRWGRRSSGAAGNRKESLLDDLEIL